MGKRSWLGSAVRVNDNGIAVDPAALRSIMDPKHYLYDRRDEFRYSMRNPAFKSFVDYIVEARKPIDTPIKIRKTGAEYQAGDQQLAFIKDAYRGTDGVDDNQPVLEVIYGNRRLHALLEAIKIWRERGEEVLCKARIRCVYEKTSDEEMKAAFVGENANRSRTSAYEDQLSVRDMMASGWCWDDVAKHLVAPVREVRRIHEPLLEAVLPVLRAYSDGTITLSRAAKIAKMPDCKQEQAISEPAAVKTPKPKRAMYDAAKVPVDALKAAALKAGERGSGPITDWLKSIGATSDAG